MPPQQEPKKVVLSSKENQLFKSIVKHYESKQFKKGLKAADTILKAHPDHGETLSMKGLILNCMDKKQEAYDYVRRGLKHDLKSHVSWHVYGLLYKSDREYNEAIKCYRNALRNDPENKQILRDLSSLQIHLRDIDGFMETRRKLLTLRPTEKGNWIAFALGAHLNENYTQALKILEEYEKTITDDSQELSEMVAMSEFTLYKNSVIEESGDIKGALENLEKVEKSVFDKIYVKEKRAELLLKLGRHDDARKEFKELLQANTENKNYHVGLQHSLKLVDEAGRHSPDQVDGLSKLYDELNGEFPRSDIVKRYPLQFLPAGDAFEKKLKEYLKPKLRKGVPSLFVDIKSLYSDQQKVKIIESTLLSLLKSLQENSKFDAEGAIESPVVTMWTNFFLAQHYDAIEDTENALKIIDIAIQHTPTVIELYIFKGRIFKHAGDLEAASDYYEKARKMDLADRYLNTKSAVYLLRADKISEAIQTVGLFTKEGEDPVANLNDMQCCWFEQEVGESYYRLNQIGKSLKQFVAIEKHFTDIEEDQFDFHTYCLRKMTLRSYVQTLRFEDHLRGHKFAVKAAKQLVKTYIRLHDKPLVAESSKEDEELAKMTPEERKKYISKKRKQEAKKALEEKEQKEKEQRESATAKKRPADKDPEGKTHLEVADKLEEAAKYMRTLRQHSAKDLETQLLACELYTRKKKFLLVLQAVLKARALAPNHPQVHKQTVKLLHTVEPILDTLKPVVRDVIKTHRDQILGGKTIQAFNQEFQKKASSLPERQAAAETLFFISPSSKSEALGILTNLDGVKGHRSLKDTLSIYDTIVNVFGDAGAAEEYKKKLKALFPRATRFMDQTEIDQLRKQREAEQAEDKREADTKAEETK